MSRPDESPSREVFVLFGYLGACAQRLELAAGIVILLQRRTTLAVMPARRWTVSPGRRFAPRRRHRLGIMSRTRAAT
jgi:hypothetical protein